MKNRILVCLGLLLAISAASSNCLAVIYQFDGSVDNNFLTSGNWSILPGMTPDPGVPDDSTDRAIINDNFVVSYATNATTTVGSMIIGADWPVTGDLGTPGTLNMSAGKFIVTGPGDSFQIGRACCAGDGAMYMTGDAELEIGGSDPIVGTRENGLLDIGGSASVYNTAGVDNYWRLGNYGPSTDAGLEGNGVLYVHDNGSFRAHVIFIGDNDSSGEIRVADNGSVILTGNLVPRPSGPVQAMGSAVVQMIGSNATLSAYNLESESLVGEIPTKYVFEGDAGGVSPITLVDAVNITNNDLVVDLNGFDLPLGGSHLLFDAAPDRIFGTFNSVTVLGGNPNYTYAVIYKNALFGDIVLQRVPEPSTMGLALMGLALVYRARRRWA